MIISSIELKDSMNKSMLVFEINQKEKKKRERERTFLFEFLFLFFFSSSSSFFES